MFEARSGVGKPVKKLTKLGDEPRLNAVYGEGKWIKMEHNRTVSGGKKIEIHWFRNLINGDNVEFKFIRRR